MRHSTLLTAKQSNTPGLLPNSPARASAPVVAQKSRAAQAHSASEQPSARCWCLYYKLFTASHLVWSSKTKR